ncbi:MAG: cobyrinate a,c-diamide synthase [Chloroflexi bacterium]|nr:cobyrinate a,c-diamide synthase [Chloroflexota bacterium]
MIPRVVIAGTSSGVGKTTLTAGVVAALRKRGLAVQPFKCGPDYIDPSYHTVAAGLPCRNLDSWMVDRNVMVGLFARAAQRADIAVVEGVMGLYDGRSGANEAGSTAEIAKALRAPVVLVVDVAKMARSAGAVVLGYRQFDPDVDLAGIILSQIGSPAHLQLVKQAIQSRAGVPVVGYVAKNADIRLPERHLGLVPTVEDAALVDVVERIRQQIEITVDIDVVLQLARSAPLFSVEPFDNLFPPEVQRTVVTIGIARDEAFDFYYQDNLDLLEAWGARLRPVSPLRDAALPIDIDGLYVGGGFPELYAAQLAANDVFMQSLRSAHAGGMPIYGECGGLMYLSQEIVDFDAARHEMVGLIPGSTIMRKQRVRMGYVEVEALENSILAEKGRRLRGHEFHWSELENLDGHPALARAGASRPAFDILAPSRVPEGFVDGNLLASYVHLHFGSDPTLARRFVASCDRWARRRQSS